MVITRDPDAAAAERFDLIIVGGGIYGIMLAHEAVSRSLRPLVVERDDFCAATSHNSLRIVHGGLRYLQTGDLHRYAESVAARRWFLARFPGAVRPLPCLMPLYGDGLRRPSVLRAVLKVNDLLSWRRNAGLPAAQVLDDGRVVGPDAVAALFPGVDTDGLKGAAIWHDACIPSAPRLFVDILAACCDKEAVALNYVEAVSLLTANGRTAGIVARDSESGREYEFQASVVINAAGPRSGVFAKACDGEAADLFTPSLAWNMVIDRPPPSAYALAVKPKTTGGRTYFLMPWKGVILAGTGHQPWDGPLDDARPTQAQCGEFLDDLNRAIPGLHLGQADIVRVFAGLLPAARPGTAQLAVREVIVDHGRRGGPQGLYSLCGVKMTTSSLVANKALFLAFPDADRRGGNTAPWWTGRDRQPDYPFRWMPAAGDETWKPPLAAAIAEEAVLHLDDLLLRRSNLGDNPARALALAERCCALFPWSAERARAEIHRLANRLGRPAEPDGTSPITPSRADARLETGVN